MIHVCPNGCSDPQSAFRIGDSPTHPPCASCDAPLGYVVEPRAMVGVVSYPISEFDAPSLTRRQRARACVEVNGEPVTAPLNLDDVRVAIADVQAGLDYGPRLVRWAPPRPASILGGVPGWQGDPHLRTEARMAADAYDGWWDDRDLDLEDARRGA